MKFPMIPPTDIDPADPLAKNLRRQAGVMDPELPPGLHRRIAGALAAVNQNAAGVRDGAPLRWWALGGAAVAAGVALAVFVSSLPTPKSPNIIPTEVVIIPGPGVLQSPTRTPLALAREWVDNPLETELRNILSDVSRATDTVTSVLPAPAKRKAEPRGNGAGV